MGSYQASSVRACGGRGLWGVCTPHTSLPAVSGPTGWLAGQQGPSDQPSWLLQMAVWRSLPTSQAPAPPMAEDLSPISRVPCLERPAPSPWPCLPSGDHGASGHLHRASLAPHRGSSRHASKEPTVSSSHPGPNSGARVISGHQETVGRGPIPIPRPRLLHWAPSENKDSWV